LFTGQVDKGGGHQAELRMNFPNAIADAIYTIPDATTSNPAALCDRRS